MLAHFIVASDVDRTRRFYAGVLGGTQDDGRTGVRCGQGTSGSGCPGSKRH